jgi:hypothetical protein
MSVAIRVGVAVGMAVMSGRDRVEVDPRRRDGGLCLGTIALWVITREPAPRLH